MTAPPPAIARPITAPPRGTTTSTQTERKNPMTPTTSARHAAGHHQFTAHAASRATSLAAIALIAAASIAIFAPASTMPGDLLPAIRIRASSDPIIDVTGDTELAAVADRGNGTVDDPYIIENKVILGGYFEPCIRLQGTNAHLVIRNCSFFNSSLHPNVVFSSVYMENCRNVVIENNDLSSYLGSITVEGGGNNTIRGNDVYHMIDISNSDDNLVTGNSVYYFVGQGNGNTIWGNAITTQISSIFVGANNTWDNGTHGNYWGDYRLRYPNATHDGVRWNTPYTFFENNSDNHPLVHDPFAVPVVDPWQVAFGITAAAAGGVIAGLAVVVARLNRQITGRTP